MSRVIIAGRVFRLVVAVDDVEVDDTTGEPDGETDDGQTLVDELRDAPAENWEKYLQPIIIQIRARYGLDVGDVKLLNPHIKSKLTAPQYGFAIVGHVKFLPEPPTEVREDFGLPPYQFEALVTPDGKLVSAVRLSGSEV